MVKITPLIASILLSMVAAQDQEQGPAPTGTDFAFPTGTDAIPFPSGTGGFGGFPGGPGGHHSHPGGFPSGFPTGGFGGEGFGHHSGGGPRPTGGFGGFGGERPTGGKSSSYHTIYCYQKMLTKTSGFGGGEGPRPTGGFGGFPGGDESGAPSGPQP